MTLAEVQREVESYNRRREKEAQEKATFDYILADLIGCSVGRMVNKTVKFPQLFDAYPTLFDKEIMEKVKIQKQTELSKQRFL